MPWKFKFRHAHNLLIRISQFPWVKKTHPTRTSPNRTWGSQVVTGMLNPSLQRDVLMVGTQTSLMVYDVEENAEMPKKTSRNRDRHPWICGVQHLSVPPKDAEVGTWKLVLASKGAMCRMMVEQKVTHLFLKQIRDAPCITIQLFWGQCR